MTALPSLMRRGGVRHEANSVPQRTGLRRCHTPIRDLAQVLRCFACPASTGTAANMPVLL
ncbi:MAG: hypothetical protein ACRDRY_13535 [Pseudonocardiaceae bacterium]